MRRLTLILTTILLVAMAVVLGRDTGALETPDNLPRALAAQRSLVAAHPDDASAHNDLANLLVLAGDLEAAEQGYRRAVELAPDEPAFHYNLALLLQQRGAFNKAAEQYRRVVELTPGNAWAHYQLGVIYEVKGLSRKAIESYGRALQLDASLAFPDVNPSVIESHLLTEAMLRGYRRGLSVPQAPRVYREPGRITSLLIQAPEEGGDETPAEAAGGTPEGTETAAPVRGETDGGPQADTQERTLSQGDLNERRVNQATPQGRAGYRPPGSRPTTPRTVRTWRPPSEQQGGDAAGTAGRRSDQRPQAGAVAVPAPADAGREADEPQERPGTGRRLAPGPRTPNGVGSTGRLEMVLEPAAEQPA